MAAKNQTGISTKTTVNNNVFYFIETLRENYELLDTTATIKKLDESGNVYTDVVPSSELQSLKDKAGILLSSFISYMENGLFTDSTLDKQITELKLDGAKNKEIIEALGLKSSTLRVRYSRITKKVYRDVFNRETVPSGLAEFTNATAMNRTIMRLRACNIRVSLEKNLPYEYKRRIDSIIEGVTYDKSDITQDSYVNALYLLFICSRQFFETMLTDISPEALAFVVQSLRAFDYNKVSASYGYLLENVESMFTKSRNEIAETLKTELKARNI